MFQKAKMLWKPNTELRLVALDLASDHHNILTSQPAPMCTPSPSKAEVSVKSSQSFKSFHSECKNSKNRCNIFSSGFHPRLPEVPLRTPLAFPGSVDRDCRALAMAEAVHVCLMQEEADFQARDQGDQGYKCWKRAPEVQIKSGALKISKIWIQHTIPLHRKVEEHRSIFQRETRQTEMKSTPETSKRSKTSKAQRPKGLFRLLPRWAERLKSDPQGQLAREGLDETLMKHDESFGKVTLLRDLDSNFGIGLVGLVLQASGPHFCPGGNVNARIREGETAFTLAPFTGFVAELRLRQGISGDVWWVICCLHGLVQGGGLAMSQVTDFRVCDSEASIVLGNLSRGAVPCILLSGNLPLIAPLAEIIAFYLEDTVFDSHAALSLDLVQEIYPNISSTKEAAFRSARELLPMAAWQMSVLRPLLDVTRFAQEAYALQLSLKCGEAFQSVQPVQRVQPVNDVNDVNVEVFEVSKNPLVPQAVSPLSLPKLQNLKNRDVDDIEMNLGLRKSIELERSLKRASKNRPKSESETKESIVPFEKRTLQQLLDMMMLLQESLRLNFRPRISK